MRNNSLEVLVPEKEYRIGVNKIIYDELVFGKIYLKSKEYYINVINNLIKNGAQGIILGCTEIPLLIKQEDVTIPIFDTTYIHAENAVAYSLTE